MKKKEGNKTRYHKKKSSRSFGPALIVVSLSKAAYVGVRIRDEIRSDAQRHESRNLEKG
ncbi:hypothetical protein QJS10_CPB15g00730 [Acorus calamus]|uniref:Uncharacterized protein n=1 Tax=Acorus calamus TaxID=4465 RepID=A0AAV9D972_ACOCL|nr:hypothetical protein QJS10_CPB15g00730 [Acorus calamus]